MRPSVVSDRSSTAKRTKRQRLHAATAQKTWRVPFFPQSITRVSPGDHTAGRRPRWWSARHAFFALATRRRRLRAEPL